MHDTDKTSSEGRTTLHLDDTTLDRLRYDYPLTLLGDQAGSHIQIQLRDTGIELDPAKYGDWATGLAVLFANGCDLKYAQAWSKQAGDRYDEQATQQRWESMVRDPLTIPTTPREAATDTLLQLYKQGIIQTSDAINILAANKLCNLGPDQLANCVRATDQLVALIHSLNHQWWHDLQTGEKLQRNDGELLCLIHSEISEGLEGLRKNLDDTHLPQHKMIGVEMADAVIRIFDYCGGRGIPLAEIMLQKLGYNLLRQDHKKEARLAEGGKAF